MGDANVIQNKADKAKFSFQEHKPTNFLQRFSANQFNLKQSHVSNPRNGPPDVVDLNLRLSLGGIYNTGKYTKENPLTLTRSSSIPAGVVTLKKNNSSEMERSLPKSFLSLARTCSLPAEVERSKRVVNVKELRIMRRVEAKKRVAEKQRNAKITNEKEKLVIEGPPSSPSKIPAWAAASAAKSPALNRAIEKIKEGFRKLEEQQRSGKTKVPRESIPSSTSKSNSNSKPIIKTEPLFISETKTCNEKKPSPAVKLNIRIPAETSQVIPTKKAKLSHNGCNNIQNDDGIEIMKKMPSVTTTGDGPNGKKIEGFLYKYMKGQEVSIVCICHGRFLSPEEFVKHAGRIDATNPMKHINVCSTSF